MGDFDKALNKALNLLDSNPNGWGSQIDICRNTDYVRKFKLEPFSSFSTTVGERKVRLANDWHLWVNSQLPSFVDGFIQANNLIHESIHCQQITRMGLMPFLSTYAQRSGRYRLELEAYRAQIRHAMDFYRLPSTSPLYSFISSIAYMLARKYLLFGYRNENQIFLDLIKPF